MLKSLISLYPTHQNITFKLGPSTGEVWTEFMTLYRRQGSRPSPWKRNAKKQNGVWGGLTNSCEKKRSEKQRRKGKI